MMKQLDGKSKILPVIQIKTKEGKRAFSTQGGRSFVLTRVLLFEKDIPSMRRHDESDGSIMIEVFGNV